MPLSPTFAADASPESPAAPAVTTSASPDLGAPSPDAAPPAEPSSETPAPPTTSPSAPSAPSPEAPVVPIAPDGTPASPPASVPDATIPPPALPGAPAGTGGEGAAAAPLTLDEAIRIAEQNQASVTIAEQSVIGARQRVIDAQSGTRPIVTGDVSYNITGTSVPTRTVNGTRFGGTTTRSDPGLQPRVTVNYPILDGGATRATVRQARAGVTQNEAGLVATRNNLALTVASNYLAQLRADRLLELRRTQEALALTQLQRVEARVAEGAAAQVDRALPFSEYKNRQVDRIQAENDVKVAANTLRNSMGLTVGPALRPVEPQEAAPVATPVEEFIQSAMAQRPEVTQDEASVRSAEASVTLARISRRPRLDTTAGVSVTPVNPGQHAGWNVGAAVSMPIWDAGRTRAREREAQANLVSARARLEQTRKDVSAEVVEAYLNLVNARERLAASEEAVTAARANLDASTERYSLGLRGTSVVDLVSAQVQFNTANTSDIQARYDVHLAQAQLNRAVGQPSF